MRRVLIGTPSYEGKDDVWYAHSLAQTVRLCAASGIDLREIFLAYDAIIQNCRNDILALAIRHNFDDLFFIDADQDWKPEWITKLLSYPVDCVGAAVRKKSDQEELYNIRAPEGANSFYIHPNAPILSAKDMALGCGLLRLSRKAMRALWDNSEEYTGWPGKEPSRWVFDIRPVNGRLVGEDTMISEKLRQHGIETWVDPHMTCGHTGVKKYTGNFAAWLAKQRTTELSGELKWH